MYVPKGKTEKLCRCGREKILTGERAKYNAKDKQGRMICSSCVMDAVLAPWTDRKKCG